jgi:hypothetical protein
MHRAFRFGASLAAAALVAALSGAQPLYLSVADDLGQTLGGLSFADGDVAAFDPNTASATLFFSEALITPDSDLDAFHRLPDGALLLSTRASGRTIGSLTFNDGDLVRYEPGVGAASIYFISEAGLCLERRHRCGQRGRQRRHSAFDGGQRDPGRSELR